MRFFSHSQVALVVRWSGFPACSHTAVGDGWRCLESSCASRALLLCVLLSVCTRAHTPLFSVTYSPPTLFTRLCFNLRLSDTLANTLQCPDWMHCSHPGSAKERINPTHHWYLKHREAVNSIKRQARSACRQHRYCVSRTFQRRTAVIKFIAISVRI